MAVAINANDTNRGFQRSGTGLGTGDLTVKFWYRFGAGGSSGQSVILWDVNNGLNYFAIKKTTADKIQIINSSTGGQTITGATTLSTGTYYLIAAVVTGTTGNLYVGTEGSAISAVDATGSMATWPTRYTTTMSFAKDHGVSSEGIWQQDRVGRLNIWTSAFSTAQIEAERLRLTPLITSNLWGQYNMATAGTNAATALTDSSGNSRTLSLSGGTGTDWIDATDPTGLTDGSTGNNIPFFLRKGGGFVAMSGNLNQ